MSLFLNTSSLHNLYSDCCSKDVSETIERDCLSVLHKLHDQVNGLQLVQVVVQPLARLFNPASLAALVANVQQSVSPITTPTISSSSGTLTAATVSSSPISVNNNLITSATTYTHSNATTPSSINSRLPGGQQDLDGLSTSSNMLGHSNQSRSQSFASAFSGSSNANNNHQHNTNNTSGNISNISSNNNNNSLLSSTSTYMMSPDTAQALIARLDTDRDVNWLMEIIGYGLSMPFSLTGEQDSVKDCCTIYCEWLAAALLPYNEQNEDSKYQQLSKMVPTPIRKDSNRYARKMLSHLYNVFLPRQSLNNTNYSNNYQKDQSDATLAAVSRQAVLCHRVLRTIENIAQNTTNLMDNETWEHLLALLLTVNDKLLSAPTEPDDIGTQLHDRTLGVLFDLMLLASAKCIPSSELWKTFHEMSLNWRHRPALVDHWRRVTLLLTKRLVAMQTMNRNPVQCHTNSFDNSSVAFNGAIESTISSMTYENLSQTWYRFLNLIGNIVELSDPNVISRTDEFYHSACASDNVLDPRQHPCLNVLPQIFLNCMTGLKDFIETFLGSKQTTNDPTNIELNPPADRYLKSGSISSSNRLQTQNQHLSQQRPSLTSISSRSSQQQAIFQNSFKLSPDRPKCNSILHIFGDWLFSAALIGSDLNQEIVNESNDSVSEGATSFGSDSTTTELSGLRSQSPATTKKQIKSHTSFSRRQSQSSASKHFDGSISGSGSTTEKITLDPPLSPDSFETGQAEAMAILCRIFSSKTSSEDISPHYLSRFYLCLQHCLTFGSGQESKLPQPSSAIKRQLLASVLVNSTTILQKDLDGINLLVPSFIKAIEFVFDCNEKEPIQPPPRQHNRSASIRSNSANQTSSVVTNYELRRACILTLMNLLAYPFHFQDLVIRNCLNDSSPTTFGSLRPRLLKLLFVALQTETDPTNMQILFGGLSLTIHDLSVNRSPSGKEENIKPRQKNDSSSTNLGNDSANSSLEITTSKIQDDTTSQSSFVFNSSGGFLVKSLHVTCHLLINIWKHDTQVSLAALELLTTIARVTTSSGLVNDTGSDSSKINTKLINNNNNFIEMKNEYKQTTKWICDYICNQCSRPPPAHSRDMHSTIVAAYQCLSVWFYYHPYLLKDESCVNTLMEVIELGVCGQKSKIVNINSTTGSKNFSVINKSDKIMKPSSMRVREAAESLLNICMVCARTLDELGHKITLSHDTVIDEEAIIELLGGGEIQSKSNLRNLHDYETRRNEVYKSFKYFTDDDCTIFALYDGSNYESPTKDSVICLLRTPFGKHCWKMKFIYYTEKSREKIIANKTLGLIKRPFQQVTTPTFESRMFPFPGGSGHNKSLYFNNTAKFFPETIEVLPMNELDQLVTSLDDYSNGKFRDQQLKNDLDKIGKIFKHQILAEQKVLSECSIRIKRVDCEEPQALNDLESARIIVTQLGLKTSLNPYINIEAGKSTDKISASFVSELKSLDHQSVKTCDSVNIFYVRKNRTSTKEILESVRERHNVSLEFFQWILELGQPTVVKNHGRWTGKLTNSWNSRSILYNTTLLTTTQQNSEQSMQSLDSGHSTFTSRNQMLTSDHGGSIFDGERMTLYWSDMCQELAFMVPHKMEKIGSDVNIIICWLECPDDMPSIHIDTLLSPPQQQQTSDAGEQFDDGASNISTAVSNTIQTSNTRLQSRSSKDYAKYFISTMKNGLYRVNLITSFGRNWLALPLVDGMTVSKGILSGLIRESVLNLCRRRRLDADSYQPPHVKRRLKIQDICNNYKISSRSESREFYNNLFKSSKSISA